MKYWIGFIFFSTSLIINSCSTSNNENHFEGVIHYKNSYVIKNREINPGILHIFFGKTATRYFKEGSFVEKYDTGLMSEQIYNKAENKTYILKSNSDTVFWSYCNQQLPKLLSFEVNKKRATVLGIECDELITRFPDKTIIYYFNSDSLTYNPEWFQKYTDANKYKNAQIMKALPLRYEIDFKDFKVISEATSYKRKKLKPSLFSAPKGKVMIEDKDNYIVQ